LAKSTKHGFIYRTVDSFAEYQNLVKDIQPRGIIYNYYPLTMPWLTNAHITTLSSIVHYKIHHEYSGVTAFNYRLHQDPDAKESKEDFAIPRPIFENLSCEYPVSTIPVIGSFGFGFQNKGFPRLCSMVNEQFEEAIIRLHLTFSHFVDASGAITSYVTEQCRRQITKPGIKLLVTNNFLSNEGLLSFLAGNSINAFAYDSFEDGRGIASVIDYAISVNRPVAISRSNMFRHIWNATPCILLEERPLAEIIKDGLVGLGEYRDRWSNSNLLRKVESVINQTT
jgi:hypothetical protein